MPVPHISTSLPLHRIRFYDRTPSPITALSFSPLPLPLARDPKGKGKDVSSSSSNREEFGALIVARDNGEVEIWEWERDDEGAGGVGNWVLEKVLPPTLTHPTISLMSLVIRDVEVFHRKAYAVPKIADLRLLTAGGEAGEVVERCLLTGRILNTYSIPSPPIWSMTVSPTHSLLCLATTSPTLHFVSLANSALDPPPAHLLRSDNLPSKTRTVSIAWGPPKLVSSTEGEEAWEWRDTYLVTGNSDSSFRKWDLPAPGDGSGSRPALGRVTIRGRAVVEKVRKMGKNGKAASSKGTIVWGVGVLSDHTIVTSDSLGSVTFWDGASLAQKQAFRSHKADGMCLTIRPGGRSIYTSGPDQRVCQFVQVTSPDNKSQWVQTATKRLHAHDVRALSIFPPYLPISSSHLLAPTLTNPGHAPILASGGWDMSVVFTPAASPDLLSDKLRNPLGKKLGLSRVVFEESYARKMGFLGGGKMGGLISFASTGRLVVGRKVRGVGVWRVLEDEGGWEKVLEMDFRLRTNLISSTVSQDGRWMAVSDLYETKLFRLSGSTNESTLHPIRIRSFLSTLLESPLLSHLELNTQGTGASSLLFTPDGNRLVMGMIHSGQIVVLELGEGDVEVIKCFERKGTFTDGRVVLGMGGVKKKRKPRVRKGLHNGVAKVNGDGDGGMGRVHGEVNGHEEGQILNGEDANQQNGDIEMANGDAREGEAEDSPEENEQEEARSTTANGAWISSLTASDDGQWLAVADLVGRISVYNLDTLQLHALLPTLPHAPISLTFTPSHSSLLTLVQSSTVQFYHIEHRRLLPPTQSTQLSTLNNALRAQYTPILGAAWEPSRTSSRNAKLIIHGGDWLCTARLDLELIGTRSNRMKMDSPNAASTVSKSLRKKRAREAREQLELVSASPSVSGSTPSFGTSGFGYGQGQGGGSSSDDPEFYKVTTDRFKAILGVGWLGEGELAVVERPLGDFLGELPAGFVVGTFGRS